MSPVGDVLRNRCRSFPGLVGSTTIDWIFPWPDQALLAVAKVFLADHPKIPQVYRDSIITHVVYVHNSIKFYTLEYLQKQRRRNYVTPKHYLDYINTYIRLIGESLSFPRLSNCTIHSCLFCCCYLLQVAEYNKEVVSQRIPPIGKIKVSAGVVAAMP